MPHSPTRVRHYLPMGESMSPGSAVSQPPRIELQRAFDRNFHRLHFLHHFARTFPFRDMFGHKERLHDPHFCPQARPSPALASPCGRRCRARGHRRPPRQGLENIIVTYDQSQSCTLPRPAAEIIIGNPHCRRLRAIRQPADHHGQVLRHHQHDRAGRQARSSSRSACR